MTADIPYYEDTCPRCNRFISDHWRYCPHCQESLYGTCPECGSETASYWARCPSCGVGIAKAEQEYNNDISAFPCPVCSVHVIHGVDNCTHCGEKLMWLDGVPYTKTEFPSLSEQIPRRITDVYNCPLCGDVVRDNWNMCPKCGNPLHETA